MVDIPTAALGMSGTIIGGLIERQQANKQAKAVAEARNAALRQYLSKQEGLEQEGRGLLDGVVARYADGNTQLADAQGNRTGVIIDTVGKTSDPNAIQHTRDASPAVTSEIAKRMLAAYNRATDHAKAMGAVGGYGDQWFNNNVATGDVARQIGTLQNFSRGNTAILQSQQDLAEAAAYKQPSMWGSLLKGVGNLALTASGGRGLFGGSGGQGFPTVDATNQFAAAFPRPIGG